MFTIKIFKQILDVLCANHDIYIYIDAYKRPSKKNPAITCYTIQVFDEMGWDEHWESEPSGLEEDNEELEELDLIYDFLETHFVSDENRECDPIITSYKQAVTEDGERIAVHFSYSSEDL